MIRFLDGPAAGVVLELRRAPLYLRVTRDGDKVDALDQLDDEPKPDETLVAYRRVGEAGLIHLSYSSRQGRRRGRTLATAEYVVCPDQPDDATMRDGEAWRKWATEQRSKEEA